MSKELTENKKKKNRKIEKRNTDEHKDEILQVEEMEKTGEISVYQKIHLGPLPSPETLERYEKICQGAADRIITMAEKEQDYRHKINNKEIDNDRESRASGRRFSVLLISLTVLCATFLLYNGKTLEGFASLLTGLSFLLGPLFIENWNDKTEKENNEEKNIKDE